MTKTEKIAIVYDWLDKWGGVERVLLTLHEMFPTAVFFTSAFDEKKASWAKDLTIKSSFIQNLPKFIKNNRILSLTFYPYAFESFNFNEFDLVVSVTSSFAKSIITQPKTKHICYLLTPTRFLWSHQQDYLKKNTINNCYFKQLKDWDFVTSSRPDKIISISKTVAGRCLKYYHRRPEVIYPPFDIDYWHNIKSKIINSKSQINSKYFLIVSRLEPYKKVELAVKVFNKFKSSLIIVGEVTQEDKLKKIANKNVVFLKKLTDGQLGYLYKNAQALIMPQEEDFGYVSLEAQFFGCPVIAYKKGGAAETVIDGKTGIFFNRQTEDSLSKTIARFNKIKYNLKIKTRKYGLKNVEVFEKKIFINRFKIL